jgi:hypothetical protein
LRSKRSLLPDLAVVPCEADLLHTGEVPFDDVA